MTLDILPLLDNSPATMRPISMNNSQMLLDGFIINSNIRLIRKIGAGTYGLIYLVEDLVQRRQYAAKMSLKEPLMCQGCSGDTKNRKSYIQKKFFEYFYTADKINASEVDLNYIRTKEINYSFLKETALNLEVHQHPNVVTIHKVLEVADFAVIILMDYYEQGDLFTNILDKQIFCNPPSYQNKQLLMKNAMTQLIEVIQYCHKRGIYHCDLKPENIMVRYDKNYKRTAYKGIVDYDEIQLILIDFGLAMNSISISCNACRGSSYYMAPERVTNYKTNAFIWNFVDMNQFRTSESISTEEVYFPTLAGDKWSIGVLLINITCSMNPWPIATLSEDSSNSVFRNYILHDRTILRSILPISDQFNTLLNEIFRLDPNERLSLTQMKEEIADCNFFYEYVSSKTTSQLQTPPETDSENFTTYNYTSSEESLVSESFSPNVQ